MPRPAVPPAPPPGWGIVDPPTSVLRLGRHTFEVADEAVVMGRVAFDPASADVGAAGADGDDDLLRSAPRVREEGAAALELLLPDDAVRAAAAVASLVTTLDLPVVVVSGDVPCIEAALAAGAAGVVPTARLSVDHLAALAATGATLLLVAGAGPEVDRAAVAELARDATAAGLAPDGLLVEVAIARSAPPVPGRPVIVSDPPGSPALDASPYRRAERSAAFALGLARGGRLVRTSDPRTARRTAVTVAAVRQGRTAHQGSPA